MTPDQRSQRSALMLAVSFLQRELKSIRQWQSIVDFSFLFLGQLLSDPISVKNVVVKLQLSSFYSPLTFFWNLCSVERLAQQSRNIVLMPHYFNPWVLLNMSGTDSSPRVMLSRGHPVIDHTYLKEEWKINPQPKIPWIVDEEMWFLCLENVEMLNDCWSENMFLCIQRCYNTGMLMWPRWKHTLKKWTWLNRNAVQKVLVCFVTHFKIETSRWSSCHHPESQVCLCSSRHAGY